MNACPYRKDPFSPFLSVCTMNPGIPLPPELILQLGSLSPIQLAWLSGYCWSQCQQPAAQAFLGQSGAVPSVTGQPGGALAHPGAVAGGPGAQTSTATGAEPAAARRITILSASQTGNARRVASQLADSLKKAGLQPRLTGAADFKSKTLPGEDILLLVSSTQGEGEPPEEALPLHKFLFGKKAPKLDTLHFAVLGLGDSSYPKFCQAGRDFDARLAELGAHRLHDRGDCDLDFQATATAWIDAITPVLKKLCAGSSGQPSGGAHPAAGNSTGTAAAFPGAFPLPGGQGTLNTAGNLGGFPLPADASVATMEAPAAQVWTREQPFTASLSVRQKITARNAEKDVEHIEIDLSDSGIQYQPGDALGVWPVNAPDLVSEILSLHGLKGDETVQLPDGTSTDIRHALTHHVDITQNTPSFVQAYAAHSGKRELQEIVENAEALDVYLASTPPVGVFAEHPYRLPAQELLKLFRPQAPRLYSIASSQDDVGDEVHLTVGVVQFRHHGQHYTGAASGYLGHLLEEGDGVRVFVEPNPHFRLPADGDTSIIMIGAGTGIAPFRAFMQQREAQGDTGRNWLIFGNQRFTDDFLYQAEWLQYRKSGLLTRADLAWSRQGKEKVYVQHRLTQAGADVWQWLQEGAHLYVCGDANRMARDVERALKEIVMTHGGMSEDDADDYLNDLREDRRYQRDVY